MKTSIIYIVLLLSLFTLKAQDWSNTPVPANPGQGMKWELQENYSDDFNYNGKGDQFNSKWRDRYFNGWNGPGLTEWRSNEAVVTNGNLQIKASRKPGTNKVYCGVVTSKTKVIYPIYMEASIKVSNLELSSNFWMLSEDDTREIDVIEVYGGAAQTWFAQRMSTNFHVFKRNPNNNSILRDFNDQTHNTLPGNEFWRNGYHTFGVYWKSPTEITFYIDGIQTSDGSWAQATMLDKPSGEIMDKNVYKMDKPVFMIIDTEDHDWRSNQGIVASDASLADNSKNTMYVDWVRTYKPVPDVGDTNQLPDVSFSGINNGAQLPIGTSIQPTVIATDTDGSISNVKLYLNNQLIRQENVAPYEWGNVEGRDEQLKNLSNGSYNLKAEATDNRGGITSKTINFTVSTIANQQLITEGTYFIESIQNNQRLLARSIENHSARMHDPGNFNDQKWTFAHLGDNVYTIKNLGTGRFLEVPYARCGNGENVATWTDANDNHKRWKVIVNGNNSYSLQPLHCLQSGLDRSGGANNANVQIWNFNTTNPNQQWKIVPADASKSNDTLDRIVGLFPNPAKDVVTIMGQHKGEEIIVYNLLGEIVSSIIAKSDQELISISSLETGVYIVSIAGKSKLQLIKE